MDCQDQYFTYTLRCADGSYYVGHTTNVAQRVLLHNASKGAAWTASRLPVELLYHETHDSEAEAVRRERQIKGWTRAKKEALIAGQFSDLKRHARKRVRQ